MSRSKRKTRIIGAGGKSASEKKDKTLANKRLRRAVKIRLKKGDEVLPNKKEISNVYDFAKDGKVYDDNLKGKGLSK